MKILPVVILITLFTPWNMSANHTTPSLATMEGTCPVDAPDSFHVENVSTNWADVAWELMPGASKYLVKTFDQVTGLEVHSVLVSGTTTGTRVSWPDNASGNMEARIWSLCTNNELSQTPNKVPVLAVILELVATGFQRLQTSYEAPCILGTSQNSCSAFNWGFQYKTAFNIEISPNVPVERYDISGFTGEHTYFRLNCDSTNSYKYNKTSSRFVITRNGAVVANLIPVRSVNIGYLYRESVNNDYIIKKVGYSVSARPTGSSNNDRDANDESAGLNFEVGPNPFHETLQWQRPAEASTSLVKISLVDLMGVRHICQELPADQTDGILNTATLASGVYLLQIESAGKLETIKVVKAQ